MCTGFAVTILCCDRGKRDEAHGYNNRRGSWHGLDQPCVSRTPWPMSPSVGAAVSAAATRPCRGGQRSAYPSIMNAEEARQQISQMVEFIRQEVRFVCVCVCFFARDVHYPFCWG